MKLHIALISLLLTACASDGVKFRDASKDQEKSAEVVNYGKPTISHMSDKLGGSFGLIGAILESAATSDTSKTNKDMIANAISDLDVGMELAENLKERVARCGIKVSSRSSNAEKPADWWKSESPTPGPKQESSSARYVFETAVDEIFVHSPSGADRLSVRARLKIFNASNGGLVDKMIVTNFGPDNSIQLLRFNESGPDRDKELIEATTRSLVILSEKLTKALCGT